MAARGTQRRRLRGGGQEASSTASSDDRSHLRYVATGFLGGFAAALAIWYTASSYGYGSSRKPVQAAPLFQPATVETSSRLSTPSSHLRAVAPAPTNRKPAPAPVATAPILETPNAPPAASEPEESSQPAQLPPQPEKPESSPEEPESSPAPPPPPPPPPPPSPPPPPVKSRPPPKPLAGPPLEAAQAGCSDKLSGFNYDDVVTVFSHRATEEWRKAAVGRQRFPSLHRKNFFFAACLHHSGAIFAQWSTEMVKLLLALAEDEHMGNVYVSVYQSGGADNTPELLSRFQQALDSMGVRNSIVLGNEVRGGRNRIEFLAAVRNKAMDPIYEIKDMEFDRVIWFSDNLFCASGPMQQAVLTAEPENGGVDADAACALDFDFVPQQGQEFPYGPGCGFYDIWANHDYDGRNFGKEFPFVSFPESRLAMRDRRPFQVFACWGGMVVYKADIFTKEGLLFRRSRPHTDECPVAETELLYHDMWQLGRNKIVVAPNVPTAYTHAEYETCVRGQQKAIDFNAHVSFSAVVPPLFSCCPIEEGATFVNFGMCRMEEWSGPYTQGGIPRRKGFPQGGRRLQRQSGDLSRGPSSREPVLAKLPWPEGTRAKLVPVPFLEHRLSKQLSNLTVGRPASSRGLS